jgi:predicted membrane-bound spermidine synthase
MSRALALLLTIATGTAGLVYEVTWERMLATLLGSHAEATAAVLAFFLGGLALGYTLFGAYTRRIAASGGASSRELLRSYGVVEASIGAYAIAFELFFDAARALSLHGPSQAGLAFAYDALLSAALVVPGAALMGATIPLLTQALSRGVADATRVHAAVYGLNTFGAFFGALAASYVLLPALGMVGTLRLMGLVNLTAGLCYVAISLRAPAGDSPAPVTAQAPLRLGRLAAVACLLGFAMMTVQTALIRLGSQSLGASLFTFATVVAVFVLCIALGSLAVGALERVPAQLLPICAWCLFGLLTLLYLQLDDAPYYAHRLRIAYRDDPVAFMPFQTSVLGWMLLLIGPSVALSGAMLPLCFDRARRERGELGDAAGRLYGWNTAGSLLGALIGGYALFYWLDLHHIYRVALVALGAAAALLTPPVRRLPLGVQAAALAGLAAIAVVSLPAWDPERLSLGAFRIRRPTPASLDGPAAFTAAQWTNARIAFYDDDPTASIEVREAGGGERRLQRSLITNGKSDGSVTGDYTTTGMIALVPAWLARGAERSFVVGYGTGVTASELAMLDEAKEVIVAEISPAVAEAAPLFDFANHDASKNPKIHLVRGDAYRVLLREEGRFDVIASEPSNPWVNGVEMLYSEEFLRAAKEKLAPGGVFCQWFHLYETDPATVGLVLRTYASVFPHVAVWFSIGTDVLLLGIDDPDSALDMQRLAQRATQPDFQSGFGRAGIAGLAALLAHEIWPQGVLAALDMKGPIHTLLHPRLSYDAARAFFVAQEGPLPPSASAAAAAAGARNSLLRRYAALRGGLQDLEWSQLVRESCDMSPAACVTLLAAWAKERPDSSDRTGVLQWIRTGGAEGPFRPIDLSLVSPLMRLYGDDYPGPLTDAELPRIAREQSDRFQAYFHHAVPFHRAALASLFARCEGTEKAEECAQIRADVESELGPLAPAKLAGAQPPL